MTFNLEIITPKEKFTFESAELVGFKTPGGSVTVLSGHAPMLAALQEGRIKVVQEGETHVFKCVEGFVEVIPQKVKIFTETCSCE